MKTILALLMIVSLAVGNNGENAREALMRVKNEAGIAGNVEFVDVGPDNSYLLGLSASDVSALSSASALFEEGNGNFYCIAMADSSKNAKMIEYKKSTAFEALLGYLYLCGKIERLNEILNLAVKNFGEE